MPLIRFPGGWRLAEKTVRYRRDGEEHEQVMGDEGEQWWHDFAEKWPDTKIVEFTQLHYSPEQLARLEEVQGVGGEHAEAVRAYVLDGVVPEGGLDALLAKPEPPETTEQKLARLEQQNLIIMDALADLYEEILTLKEEEA